MNRWAMYDTQLHYCSTLVFSILGCLSYLGSAVLPIGFWMTAAPVLISTAFLINGFWNPTCRRHTLSLHFVFCVLMTAKLLTSMFIQSKEWTTQSYVELVPDGSHVALLGPDQQMELLDDTLLAVLRTSYTQMSWVLTSTALYRLLVHLCLTGLNIWSLLAFTFILVGVFAAESSLENFTLIAEENACFLAVGIITFAVIALVFERIQRQKFLAEMLLQQQMHAAETADSILNHMLKNTFADVAGNVELFLGGRATEEVLTDAMSCLKRGMRVCKERQAYLKVVAGTYTPMLHPVELTKFGHDLVAGRLVTTNLLDAVVVLDSTLLTLILENALSNAIKHGRQDNPDVVLTVRELEREVTNRNTRRLEFAISNNVDQDRTPLDSSAIFEPQSVHGSNYAVVRAPMLSDGIGLSHAKLAADMGKIAISLTQDEFRVTFRTILDAEILTGVSHPSDVRIDLPIVGLPKVSNLVPSSTLGSNADAKRFKKPPPGLCICVLDDSAAALKLVAHQIKSELPDATVKTFGARESDVDLFTAMAVESADVVIVDQHLDYKEQSYLGTSIVRRLQLYGYKGLTCIRSADDSADDQLQYAQSGAHCFLSKNIGGDFVHRIVCAYHEFVIQDHLPDAGSRMNSADLFAGAI